MDTDRELSCWRSWSGRDRLDAWLRIPAADRERLVRTLAELMIRQADREMGDESAVADQAAHLERLAVVYVRQSTPNQVVKNRESQQRQYGLAIVPVSWDGPTSASWSSTSDLGHSAASKGTRSASSRFASRCRGARSERYSGSRFAVGAQHRGMVSVAGSVSAQRHHSGRGQSGLCAESPTMTASSGHQRDFFGSGCRFFVPAWRVGGGARPSAESSMQARRSALCARGNLLRKDPDVRVRTAIETVFARFPRGRVGFAGGPAPARRGGAASKPAEECGSRDLEGHHLFAGDGDPEKPGMGGAYAYREGPARVSR